MVGRELRISDGLLWRRHRAIPLERLQAVELRRPLLAQLTGLAELRLEVVGGSKTEAPLAYLTVRDAAALRERLLALAGRTENAPRRRTAPVAPPAERPLFRVDNRDLVISQLLTPQAFFCRWASRSSSSRPCWRARGRSSASPARSPRWPACCCSRCAACCRTGTSGWPATRTAGCASATACSTRSQTVPLHRVQSVTVTWPLLWRAQHWLHLRLDIAGLANPERREGRRLRPAAAGGRPADRALAGLGGAAQRRPAGAGDLIRRRPGPAGCTRSLLRFLGAGLSPEVFVAREGMLTRQMSMVPYARLQSVRVVQGPIQRWLRLATVYVDTAGGPVRGGPRPGPADAWVLADQLAVRARLARGPAPEGKAMEVPEFAPGLTARVELTVTDADTAQSLGSGDVPVLGTPRVLALAEAATVAATARQLPGGMTTVGIRAEVDHRAPTPVGRRVTAQATLAKVDGRRLLFEVAVRDGERVVAEVRVERALLDRQRFIATALGS